MVMSDTDPIAFGPGAATAALRTTNKSLHVTFDRRELRAILEFYGQRVAEGEWRDYAIDFRQDSATFSVFRHASEAPLYRITKTPRLRTKQGLYSIVTPTGLILKRGHDLGQVLKALEKKSRKLRLIK
jgi:hypothetical protein